MKIRIKTHNGELPSYLTTGKIYEATVYMDGFMDLVDDEGEEIACIINRCPHLNGGSWEVVE